MISALCKLVQVESGKLVLEENEFDLGRDLEGLIDMFSVQCMNHNVETVLDLSGMIANVFVFSCSLAWGYKIRI